MEILVALAILGARAAWKRLRSSVEETTEELVEKDKD